MTGSYTPGPWGAEFGADGYFFVYHKDGIELRSEGGANERLIAAAPNMINALLCCVEAMRAYIAPDGILADEAMNRIIGALDNPEITPIILEAENGRS